MARQQPAAAAGGSLGAENTARGESVLLAAARFRCLGERVSTTYTRFHLLDDVESIGATSWPLREPAPRRRALAMATQDKYGFQGGDSQPDPGERRVRPAPGGDPPKCGGNRPKCPQNEPKWPKNAFWGHFRPFGGHIYPFWTI